MKKFLSVILSITMLLNVFAFFAFAKEEEDEGVYYNIQISGTADYKKSYELFDRINNYRGVNKLGEFKTDKRLIDAAMQRAAECAVYYSTARPDSIDDVYSCKSAIPEYFSNGAYEYNKAIIKTIDELFNNESSGFYNIIKTKDAYKTVGIGMVYHNGIYFCVILASKALGEPEKTRTLTQETTDFDIRCEESVLKEIVTEPESLIMYNENTDAVFIEGVNMKWNAVKFIINPQQITVSDEKVINAEIMKNAIKVTALSAGKSEVGFTLKSEDNKNEINGKFNVVVNEPEPEPVVLMGDVTGDGKLTVVDAKWMLQILAGSRKLTNEMLSVIDVNGDTNLSVVDAKWVLQAIAGIRDKETYELIKK